MPPICIVTYQRKTHDQLTHRTKKKFHVTEKFVFFSVVSEELFLFYSEFSTFIGKCTFLTNETLFSSVWLSGVRFWVCDFLEKRDTLFYPHEQHVFRIIFSRFIVVWECEYNLHLNLSNSFFLSSFFRSYGVLSSVIFIVNNKWMEHVVIYNIEQEMSGTRKKYFFFFNFLLR